MRLLGRDDDIALQTTKNTVTEWLREIYTSGTDASALTEGLMELGEKICIPAGIPLCSECPLQSYCTANREDRQMELPKKSPKKDRRYADYTVLILHRDGKFALRKRPNRGLLAGLWEFPNCEGHRSISEIEKWLTDFQIFPVTVEPCGTASHIFTHVTWNMIGMIVECQAPSDEFHWFNKKEILNQVAIPTAFRYFLQQLSDRYTED
jgi:A/G-specific adenine glycosylase